MVLIWTYYWNYFSTPSITICNNLPYRIYYENVVKMLWTYYFSESLDTYRAWTKSERPILCLKYNPMPVLAQEIQAHLIEYYHSLTSKRVGKEHWVNIQCSHFGLWFSWLPIANAFFFMKIPSKLKFFRLKYSVPVGSWDHYHYVNFFRIQWSFTKIKI